MANGLRDYNPQKEKLFQVWLTLAANSAKLKEHGRMMDRAEANDSAFGAAIEQVYAPDDAQHERPLSMITLGIQIYEWIEGRITAPEWIRHAGLAD